MFIGSAETGTCFATWRVRAADESNIANLPVADFLGGRTAGERAVAPPPALTERAASDFPAAIRLADLNGDNGFRIDGVEPGDRSGVSVSSAGDINGDGFGDVIIGAEFASPNGLARTGASYVVFGKGDAAGGLDASFALAGLDGTNGFRLDGIGVYDFHGDSVSSAGDINGDGFDDVIIGAFLANPGGRVNAGECYVVFGKAGGFTANLAPAELDGTNGFRLGGIEAEDYCGDSVSSAGDVNGDGFDDIIVGAPEARGGRGESYVLFGKADGFSASVSLANLDGTNGFRIARAGPGGSDGARNGEAVSSAGDINGDGFDDILVSAPFADADGDFNAGESYVVFGKADGFAASIELERLDGSNGFRIDGIDQLDRSGYSVSSAGDINGDGFDEIIIGADEGDPGKASNAGESYVVFGKASGFAASLDLASLNGVNGFQIDGTKSSDRSGFSVSDAGDVNGDGFDDIIIGARNGGSNAEGASYVVFGKTTGFTASIDLADLDGLNGFRLDGVGDGELTGASVSSAGDVNGDGFDDIIVGGRYAGPNGAGASYVVYGRAPTEAVTRIGSAADQTIRGGNFDDILRGKGGDDTLAGGDGHDRLVGGKGADDFVLASAARRDSDGIIDFSGDDRIALDGDVFGLAKGALVPGRFVIGGTAQDANDRLIYDDATGRLFFDADGTGAEAQVQIARFADTPVLTASDFVVI